MDGIKRKQPTFFEHEKDAAYHLDLEELGKMYKWAKADKKVDTVNREVTLEKSGLWHIWFSYVWLERQEELE